MILSLCRTWYLLTAALGALLLAGCDSQLAELNKRDASFPKVVLQTLAYSGVELAAWTQDDKFIITAVGQTRAVQIWEVATGHIVDRLTLPSHNSARGGVRRLRAMEVSADNRTLTIYAESAAIVDAQYGESRVIGYAIDLTTKTARIIPPPSDLKPVWDGEQIEQVGAALRRLYEGDNSITYEEAETVLPPLPSSHDGKWRLRRLPTSSEASGDDSLAAGGLELVHADGSGSPRRLTQPPKRRLADAALSPNGRYFAILDGVSEILEGGEMITPYQVFDLEAAEFLPADELPGKYNKIQWLDEQYILADTHTAGWERFETDTDPSLPDAIVIEQEIGAIKLQMPGRCYLTPAPGEIFYGAPVSNCRQSAATGSGGVALERFEGEPGKWQPFSDLVLAPGEVVDSLAVSSDGTRVFAAILQATEGETGDFTLALIDAASGQTIRRHKLETRAYLEKPVFTADGTQVVFSLGQTMHAWTIDNGALSKLALASVDTSTVTARDNLMAIGGFTDDAISIFDLATGKTAARLDYSNILAGGFVSGKPLYWALSDNEGIRIWDTRDWSELLTIYVFNDQGFMTVTPTGRYDSNIHPYKARFRWLVPDEPFQSLNPDTFSRDYYTPGLGYKQITCAIEGNCAEVFAPLRSIADLNRTLPKVRIRSVTQLPEEPAKAEVILEIAEGINPDARNGKTHSGIFDPRLLRNYQLAVEQGSEAATRRLEIEEWREAERVKAPDGRIVLRRIVTLPTGDALPSDGIVVTAYAFNEDRLKGETAQYTFMPDPVAPRPRRAYIISIGIDHYRETRLNLTYAGADAALMQDRLGKIPGYDTRALAIVTGQDAARGKVPYVTKNMILPILAILAGRNRNAMLAKLRRQGIDASMLEAATPDDLVLLSYSGHGWADRRGEFYIVPSEASWGDGSTTPEPTSLLSSLELAAALQAIDAGEMALIIDACHAAASVDAGSFKPGPLGDPGLGQLAFDKGVRILSATQADDVAVEASEFRHGLLTYVLARKGLGSEYLVADADTDLKLDLREWLAYSVWRLPRLSEELQGGGSGDVETRALVFLDSNTARPKPRIQKPSLFDFNISPPRTVVPQGEE